MDDAKIELETKQGVIFGVAGGGKHNQGVVKVRVDKGAGGVVYEAKHGVLEVGAEGLDRPELDCRNCAAQLQAGGKHQQQLERTRQVFLDPEEVEVILRLLHALCQERESQAAVC